MSTLKAGPRPELHKLRNTALILISVVLATTAVVFVYLTIKHRNSLDKTHVPTGKSSANLASAADEQKRYQQAIDNNLKKGDINSYQLSELELANQFISQNNYTSAADILSQVQKNVPKGKLVTYYYQVKFQVDLYKKDAAGQKSDLQTLINMLKSTNQNTEANYYQERLNKL